jgi:hypothetical protein
MVAFGLIFNYIFGLTGKKMKDMREKAKSLQERLKNAQMVGDPQMMQQVQMEAMSMTKDMMKRQFIPMCIRCILFLGIFFLLSFIYSDYKSGVLPFEIPLIGDGWFAVYFLFSFAFSILFYLIRFIYKKITGRDKASVTKEMMEMVSPSNQASGEQGVVQYSDLLDSEKMKSQEGDSKESQEEEISKNQKNGDDWKKKLE